MNHPSSRMDRVLRIPRRALVLLVGISGSGKTTLAREHFSPFQIVSSDYCRGLVCDDEADQSATKEAFELLHYIVEKRLQLGKLTVVDATNVEVHARRSLMSRARDYNFVPVAVVLDIEKDVALAQNMQRPDRQVAGEALHFQHQQLRSSKAGLSKEGFSRIYVLKSPEEIRAARFVIEE
jgi:protein phosphatase